MATTAYSAPFPEDFLTWSSEILEPVAEARPPGRSGDSGASDFDPEVFRQADLLCVEFADGSSFYTQPLDFAARNGALQAPATPDFPHTRAGGASTSGDYATARVRLPFTIGAIEGSRRSNAPTGTVLRYQLARLTPKSQLDRVFSAGSALMGNGRQGNGPSSPLSMAAFARRLCHAYEDTVRDTAFRRSGDDPAEDGWLQWVMGTDGRGRWQRLEASAGASIEAGRPVVVFLHGTASSTQGSFGDLWTPARPGGPLPADFENLQRNHVLLAWEHRSLTASPVRNARQLMEALAALRLGSRAIHLVSHSRGGLVGELLSIAIAGDVRAVLGNAVAEAASDEAQSLRRSDWQPSDRDDLEALANAAEGNRLTLGRFVRVACPARGTLLADNRTDLFLSLLLRSLGLAVGGGGVAAPLLSMFQNLVRGLVAARADAGQLPGLEAMIPGSALTIALNYVEQPNLHAKQPLRVIAGDSSGLGWFGVLSLLSDVFYGLHDHDVVVHTHSMFGGVRRAEAMSLRLEDRQVTHFSYFKAGSRSRQALFEALDGQDRLFTSLDLDEQRTRGWREHLKRSPESRVLWVSRLDALEADTTDRPVLFVLPGIMGSELTANGERVWLEVGGAIMGRLRWLDLQSKQALLPTGVMPVAYERLLVDAEKHFVVLPFAYDWREPILKSAQAFANAVDEVRKRVGRRTMHVLAHSMGGLVARTAFFHEQIQSRLGDGFRRWTDFVERGGRLLMLGTPNRGSYAPVQVLTQQHRMSRVLSVLASRVGNAELAGWAGRFHGLLEMLPSEPDPVFGNLYDPATWAVLATAGADAAQVRQPDGRALEDAAQFRGWLDGSFAALRDNERVLYVAGQGTTPVSLIDPRNQWTLNQGEGGMPTPRALGFRLGTDGDGTVPWNSTLAPARTWYVNCEHGDLADDPALFAAYYELLNSGRSDRLSQAQPRTRSLTRGASDEGNEKSSRVCAGAAMPSLPVDVAAYVLGVTRGERASTVGESIEVRIVHGSLDYAHHPLLVGHYQNERLTGTVKRVDQKLGGQLQRMLDLRLFVGAAMTGAYLRSPQTDCTQPPAYPGAIVLGLGEVGELTPTVLAGTVTRNVLRYVFEHLHRDPWVPADGPLRLQLSSVLVGTHVQAILPRDSLAALLNGIWHANQLLCSDARLIGRAVRVSNIEILEIREDVALDTAYELKRLLERREWHERFVWPEQVLASRVGGMRGYRPGGGDGVWQRLIVRHDGLGGLKFELIGARARVESTNVQADVTSLRAYIMRLADEGVSGRIADEDLSTLGVVLFQYLLPQELKSRIANFDNTVLVVDDESASFPWELLTPPADMTPGADARPLAVQAGFIRQRLSNNFRQLPKITGSSDVLLVGAPCTSDWKNEAGESINFPDLRGARDEVKAIADLLHADTRWTPHVLDKAAETFERVLTALVRRPYRMLHLAGHGVVNQWIRLRNPCSDGPAQAVRHTGMVLSHQRVLQAADVRQMLHVPEFVFINCCYSGRDHTSAANLGQRYFPQVAASLAMEFIALGAKAVVAAGWQVDDEQGKRFAIALYRLLLDNHNFGEAVREARREVHGYAGPRAGNTWGSYQCYGDPDWRLRSTSEELAAGVLHPRVLLEGVEQCMSPHELAQRLRQVVAAAGDGSPSPVVERLQQSISALDADPRRAHWLRDSDVQAALGEVFRELGEYDSASQWFSRAGTATESQLRLKHVEEAAGSFIRAHLQETHVVPQLLRDLSRLQRSLATLDLPTAAGARSGRPGALARSELLCTEGGHAMRVSQGTDAGWLQKAASLFCTAHSLKTGLLARHRQTGSARSPGAASSLGVMDKALSADHRAYALSSAILCLALNRLAGGQASMRLGVEPAARALIEELNSQHCFGTYWEYTNLLDLRLALWLWAVVTAGEGGVVPEAALGVKTQPLTKLLDAALARWPSPNEVDSSFWRIDAMYRALKGAGQSSDAAHELLATLDTLAGQLLSYMRREL